MLNKVTKLALSSRIFVIILQYLFRQSFLKHTPDVFRKPVIEISSNPLNRLLEKLLTGLQHWDGEYFLHIAEHGYSYENTLAFYPGYPLTVRYVANIFHRLGFGITLHNWMLFTATALNICFFCLAAKKLYDLSNNIFDDLSKSWNSVLLFCFNPASIFFTAAYSEAFYCWLTFSVMYECLTKKRCANLIFFLSLSIITRSNGLTNIGFPIYFGLIDLLSRSSISIWRIIRVTIIVTVSIIPLLLFNFYAYKQYCDASLLTIHNQQVIKYAMQRGYILSGQQHELPPWCKYNIPLPYSYIQSHYWNVGLFKYYELKQIPNFLLALPILVILNTHNLMYIKSICSQLFNQHMHIKTILKGEKTLPFVLHNTFLVIVCTLYVHIQVSTRLLCAASPCFYWYAADYFPKTVDKIKLKSIACIISVLCVNYFLLGTIFFSNNLPWT